MKGATPHTTIRRRRLALVASGIALAIAAVLIMLQPVEPERRHLYGDTYVHQEGEWTVYSYEDIGAECRFKPTEWERPICRGFEK